MNTILKLLTLSRQTTSCFHATCTNVSKHWLACSSPNFSTSTTLKETCDTFQGHIPLDDLKITYCRSSGPGGQHVNKTESRVEIRFHVPSASWIPPKIRDYLLEKEQHRITKDGYFVISSDRTRKQLLNQADCLERIRRLIRECETELFKPPLDPDTLEKIQQRKTQANEQRLRAKKMMSYSKQTRRSPTIYDD